MDKDKTIHHSDVPHIDCPPEIVHTGGPPSERNTCKERAGI